MEEKKISPYQVIGFLLIIAIMFWMLSRQKPPTPPPNSTPENTTPSVEKTPSEQPVATINSIQQDSLQQLALQSSYGIFSKLFIPISNDVPITIENDDIFIAINPKGGQITKAMLKQFTNYQGQPLYLINDNNSFNVSFTTLDGRILNSQDFYFTPELKKVGSQQIISLKATITPEQFFEFVYIIDKDNYMIDFAIQSQGLSPLLNSRVPKFLKWENKTFRNSKSVEYENRYTKIIAGRAEGKKSSLSAGGSDEETIKYIKWIAYKQHFFSTIMVPQKAIETGDFTSENLAKTKNNSDVNFTKHFTVSFALNGTQGEFQENFRIYFGPTEYNILKKYELGLEKIIPFGWGIFGWLNKYVFSPLFKFLATFFPYGIVIIIMTLIVRIILSPITYKHYISQIKMQLLRPEMNEINKKHKDNPQKRQQEMMLLYNKAGVNPMAGCIPALLQGPIFYALFLFFPTAFALRQKSFLWADDLASYDVIAELPFNVPFYGDHISLFPILASVAILIYTQMTMSQQTSMQQPGMPNMKIIMYIMPVMMLFFFNNYASGLSLYYFVSNTLTIILMLIIKKYIIDERKIHAQIEENKKNPKKKSGFSAKLQKMMEEAEKRKKARKK